MSANDLWKKQMELLNVNITNVSCYNKSRNEQRNVTSVLTCLAAPIHVTHNSAPNLRQDEYFEKI